jgi:hypothetical protein
MPGANRTGDVCKLEGCEQWHRFQITLPHDLHAELKTAVEKSKFASMKELTITLFQRWMARQALNEEQPRQQLVIQYDELKAASRDEIRALCAQLGITQSGKTVAMMLTDIYAASFVRIDGKPGRPRKPRVVTTPLR